MHLCHLYFCVFLLVDAVTNKQLSSLAREFDQSSWLAFGHGYLGVSPTAVGATLTGIDASMKAVRLLQLWQSKMGALATVEHLCSILKDAERNQVAEEGTAAFLRSM